MGSGFMLLPSSGHVDAVFLLSFFATAYIIGAAIPLHLFYRLIRWAVRDTLDPPGGQGPYTLQLQMSVRNVSCIANQWAAQGAPVTMLIWNLTNSLSPHL
jgi:hypothetical protein